MLLDLAKLNAREAAAHAAFPDTNGSGRRYQERPSKFGDLCKRGHRLVLTQRPSDGDRLRRCLECEREKVRRYKAKHREALAAYQRDYRRKQKEHDMWKTDIEGQYLCSDCNRGLDDAVPILVLGDDGMVPICGRCSMLRRARMAAADAVEATALNTTSEGGWN